MGRDTFIALCGLALLGAPLSLPAATYVEDFTGFEGSAIDPANFTISTDFGDVVLSGSTAGVGNFSSADTPFPAPLLYSSGNEAWIAEPLDVLTIVFPTPMSSVSFWSANTDVDDAIIEVEGSNISGPSTVSVPQNSGDFFTFTGEITGVTLTNPSIAPDLDRCLFYCSSIDDLTFTAVIPLPPTLTLFVPGLLAGLGWLRRRSPRHN